jgi:hypothetical protein
MIEEAGLGSTMRFTDGQRPVKGILRYTVFKKGIPIEEVEDENLIVNGARLQMAHLVAGDFIGRNIKKIAFGTNGNLPVLTDTQITNAFIKDIDRYLFPADGKVQFNWTLNEDEANGLAIIEFGLLTAGLVLFSRRIREDKHSRPLPPINKEDDTGLEGQWILEF